MRESLKRSLESTVWEVRQGAPGKAGRNERQKQTTLYWWVWQFLASADIDARPHSNFDWTLTILYDFSIVGASDTGAARKLWNEPTGEQEENDIRDTTVNGQFLRAIQYWKRERSVRYVDKFAGIAPHLFTCSLSDCCPYAVKLPRAPVSVRAPWSMDRQRDQETLIKMRMTVKDVRRGRRKRLDGRQMRRKVISVKIMVIDEILQLRGCKE